MANQRGCARYIFGEDFKRLSVLFEWRPEGRGQFGYDDDNTERVKVPGTNLFGVQLNEILQSRPADLAGIKPGDIVIQFGDIPIRTEREFLMRVRRAIPYTTVDVVVMRGAVKPEAEPVEDGEDAKEDGKEGKEVKEAKLEKVTIPVKMGKQ